MVGVADDDEHVAASINKRRRLHTSSCSQTAAPALLQLENGTSAIPNRRQSDGESQVAVDGVRRLRSSRSRLVPRAGATSNEHKTTYLTFSHPLRLPGVALGSGTYIFEIANPDSGADVVRVMSRDRSISYFMGFTRAVARPHTLPRESDGLARGIRGGRCAADHGLVAGARFDRARVRLPRHPLTAHGRASHVMLDQSLIGPGAAARAEQPGAAFGCGIRTVVFQREQHPGRSADWQHHPPIRDRRQDWRRRDGRGLQGDRHEARSRGRAEIPSAAVEPRRGRQAAVPA